jgi:PAS domain S-box-containing protein
MLKRGSNILSEHDYKLALSFGALVLILMLTVSGAASYLFSQQNHEQEDRLSGVIAVILGESISRVSFSSKYQARLFVEDMKSRVPELAFISVETKDGLILAHSDPRKNNGFMSDPADADLRILSLKSGSAVGEEQIRDGKTVMQVVLPFRGGPDDEVIGLVRTGINFDEVRKEQRVNFIMLLILVVALTAAAIWAVLILSHHFGSTVRTLATQLQGILDHAPTAICICDRTGRILAYSEEFGILFGSPAANQTSAQLFAARLSASNIERLAETDRKVFESGVPCEQELQVDIQGRFCTWSVSKFSIARDNDGKTTLICAFIHDISERKQAEAEIRKLNQELEQRVSKRTAELEAANKELEAFSYTVSHDLRTPLRAIDGFSHILLEDYTDKLDDEGKRLLNVVRDNTSRMGQLIDDILKFSRSGRSEINFFKIDMERLARAVFAELQSADAESKVQLEVEAIPPARGDSAMLRQVLTNLLSNAIKFSRTRATPRIQVGATIDGNETIYFVKDNGVGYDMQYADKLFGVFQRLHGIDEFEGTGIGLAIVKRIIRRHGGRVWAEGRVNEGATFYFSLPRL